MENTIIEKIKWNEEITGKLNGALHQLRDIEEQKARALKNSFSQIKNELRKELLSSIPDLLKKCSSLVNENSDFSKVHIELNDEMNKQITNFIEETALPGFRVAIQEWIKDCEKEMNESQEYLNELGESFNELYGEDKMSLDCDFMVLDDWRRDINRMTRGSIQLEKANILLRFTPSQLLLKGAGKLFGSLSRNKDLLANKYKQLIESKDYSQIAETVSNQLILQFELFERSIERDIGLFFAKPFEVLNQLLEENKADIEKNETSLNNMRINPEVFRDPLTLFELQLRQYEWMNTIGDRRTP
jgi:hypothetical protein